MDEVEKTLSNVSGETLKENVSDVAVRGDEEMFKVLYKVYSKKEGWMKSTKAMEIPGSGCLVQVTTQQKNPDGSYSIAEALTFVPSVHIVDDINGGRRLKSGIN